MRSKTNEHQYFPRVPNILSLLHQKNYLLNQTTPWYGIPHFLTAENNLFKGICLFSGKAVNWAQVCQNPKLLYPLCPDIGFHDNLTPKQSPPPPGEIGSVKISTASEVRYSQKPNCAAAQNTRQPG